MTYDMMSSIDPSTEAKNFPPKQEGLCASEGGSKITIPGSSCASRSWFRLKDPRVVRVSRALGGRDRHSKVCTIRGLRDRRVRLSVPTAIQLYDLQDRLGLSQPSKVVDWLLDAAKHEIDELPPLPMEPFHLAQPLIFHQSSSPPSTLPSSVEIVQSLSSNGELGLTGGMNWCGGDNSRKPSRLEFMNNSIAASIRNNQEEKQELTERQVAEELAPPSNFSSRATDDNPNNFPYSSNIFHLEHSGVASFPHHGLVTSQSPSEDLRSFKVIQTSSASSLCQTHPYFPLQFMAPSGAEVDHRHVSQLQSMLMSSGLQNFLSSSHEPHLNSLTHHQSLVRAPIVSFDVNAMDVPSQSGSGNKMDKG